MLSQLAREVFFYGEISVEFASTDFFSLRGLNLLYFYKFPLVGSALRYDRKLIITQVLSIA